MTEASSRQSAKIYQFPIGGRTGLSAQQQALAGNDVSARTPTVAIGSWYHDEAVQEAEQARKR